MLKIKKYILKIAFTFVALLYQHISFAQSINEYGDSGGSGGTTYIHVSTHEHLPDFDGVQNGDHDVIHTPYGDVNWYCQDGQIWFDFNGNGTQDVGEQIGTLGDYNGDTNGDENGGDNNDPWGDDNDDTDPFDDPLDNEGDNEGLDNVNNYDDTISDEQKHINELKKLTSNKSDGTKTNIKIRIDQLNTARLTSLKENGYMFDVNQNTLPSYNQGSHWTAWSAPDDSYYIMLHMHQDKFIPEGTTTPKATNVAPSDTDVVGLLKLLNYTDNKNTTSIIVNRLGTFAIRVNDKGKANNAYNAIINNKEVSKLFSAKYDELITDLYEANPSDDVNIMNAFITFINTHLVNGQSMGLSFFQAVYDSQNNIINWIKI